MQHFNLTLECGHAFVVSAVDILDTEPDKPHTPDYVGRDMGTLPRCCCESHTVTAQKRILAPNIAP